MVLNFPGRWIRRAVPTSVFSNFVTLNGFGVGDAPLSHFVSHVDIVRYMCRHVWRNLWHTHSWYLCPGFEVLNSPNGPNSFLQRSYGLSRLTQPGARTFQGAPR